MSHGTTAIIQRITGPDTAIRIVQMVTIRVEIALFPSQMAFQYGPHFLEIHLVGIILKMPQQLVNVVEVHIVVMHLVVTVRIATDIAVRIHLRMPAFLRTCHLLLGILCRMRNVSRHILHLTLGVCIEMGLGTVIPTQHITQIACTPTSQRHTPANTAMQPRFSVPIAISRHHQGTT